jgi:hypothetical protein
MHARSPKLLEDIRDAAAFIGEVTQSRTLAQYSADRLLRQGMERTARRALRNTRRSSPFATS